jgi:hypothetical protein
VTDLCQGVGAGGVDVGVDLGLEYAEKVADVGVPLRVRRAYGV